LYAVVGTLFRRFEFELWETGSDAVRMAEYYGLFSKKKGDVRVQVLREEMR
jgi:hypothetical protein